MTDGQWILSSVLQATQSGQSNLLRALDTASSTELIGLLSSQLEAFDLIESEALRLAASRGWELPDQIRIPLGQRKPRLSFLRRLRMSDSKIAESLIYFYTGHMINELKVSHSSRTDDAQIHGLLQKLLYCQSSNIRQMQPFL